MGQLAVFICKVRRFIVLKPKQKCCQVANRSAAEGDMVPSDKWNKKCFIHENNPRSHSHKHP